MTKVMIVEDETLVRVGLRSIIDQNESGFEVCAEAGNGAEALKLLPERFPDIILLDIKMPHMDGMEFLKEKKRLGNNTPVIVLSCHGEYEFVREAMKLGAKDYILKLSAKPQDLLSLLEQTRTESGQYPSADTNAAKIGIGPILRGVCIGSEPWKQLDESPDLAAATISREKNHVVDMLMDRRREISPLHLEHSASSLPDSTVMTLLNSLLECRGEYFQAGDGEFVLVLPKTGQGEGPAAEVCRELQSKLEIYFKATASFGIADAQTLSGLRAAASLARKRAGMRFYLGGNILVSDEDPSCCVYGSLPGDTIPESPMAEAVLSRDREKMMVLVDEVLATISRVRPEPSVAVNCLIEMNALMMSYARKAVEPGTTLPSDLIQFFHVCQTLGEIAQGIKDFVDALYDKLDGRWKQKPRQEITDAIRYISDHYPEYISLQDIAKCFHMSTSRFCVVFKEGTGKTFVDYLNMVRIQKAEELLLHSELPIYEIAYKVGFNSTTYFSKIFKRITGYFPSEFRRC
jgi:two-component system, response regulator YesN